jgi:FtsP/CotA-like multicopper oxidase with cupredoxin domain
VSPLWKQGVGSTIHCVAGDATGIILAAAITGVLGLPMWIDLAVEYAAGFSFGLFIFQSLFMKSMMGGSYLENVRKTLVPEWISMSAMMAGMAPVMSFLMMSRDMRAMEPTQLVFWGVMSLGVIAGFVVAFPFNVWIVEKGLKHGLMTLRNGRSSGSNDEAKGNRGREGHQGHESHKMGEDRPAFAPTRAQIASIAGTAFLLLVAGLALPAFHVNLALGARDVGGLVMPPGMVMDFNTPGKAMRDMSAVDPRKVTYEAPADARGDKVLEPRVEDGVKVFDLEASIIRWHVLPDLEVDAYAYNRQVPGPRIEVNEGDRVRIHFHNALPEPTTVHWHGLILPNVMDGASGITQAPIPPGGSFTYDFVAGQAGTFFYHSHHELDRQQSLGLYGALIIRPRTTHHDADLEHVIQLQEWLEREWLTYPAMPMEGGLPNYFTINGKAYPATETIHMRVGEKLKLRFIGTNTGFIHPMHVHGGPFTVVAVDGADLPESARYMADTINVGPGQRYDVIWPARRTGKWLLHCHIAHHTTNNNVETHGGGGLMMIIDVAG